MPFFGGGGSGGDYEILTNNNIRGGDTVMPLVSGVNNIGLGNAALEHLTSGNRNICIGTDAGNDISYSTDNTIIGDSAGLLVNSSGNVLLGSYCGYQLPDTSADNTMIGNYAGSSLNSSYSVCIGGYSGHGIYSMNADTHIGFNAGGSNGTQTVGIGFNSLSGAQTAANYAIAIGAYSAYRIGSGSLSLGGAISIGHQSAACTNVGGSSAITGTDGVFVGRDNARNTSNAILTAVNAVSIGYNANRKSAAGNLDISHSIVIGANSAADGTDQIIIGADPARTFRDIRVGKLRYYENTWANRPSLATYPDGAFFFATDIGVRGCLFQKRGGVWTCPYTVMDQDYSEPVTSDVTEQIIAQYGFPAGLLRDGAMIYVHDKSTKSGITDINTRRVRMGALGTTADLIIGTINYSAANIANYAMQPYERKNNTTLARLTSGGASPYGGGTVGTPNLTTDDMDALFYVSLTTKMGGTTDSVTWNWLEIGLELK